MAAALARSATCPSAITAGGPARIFVAQRVFQQRNRDCSPLARHDEQKLPARTRQSASCSGFSKTAAGTNVPNSESAPTTRRRTSASASDNSWARPRPGLTRASIELQRQDGLASNFYAVGIGRVRRSAPSSAPSLRRSRSSAISAARVRAFGAGESANQRVADAHVA